MDSQVFQILIIFFCGLISIIGGFVVWWVGVIWNATKSTKEEVNAIRLEIAKDYVPRTELKDIFDKIFSSLEGIHKEIRHITNNQAAIKALREQMKEAQQ